MDTPDYFTDYPDFALVRTATGVLTVRLHDGDDGPAVLSERLHGDFPRLLRSVGEDRDNRVLVLTGTGDRFMTGMRMTGERQVHEPAQWDEVYREGRQVLAAYTDLPMPVVAAINGPATVHSEWVLLADITVAADTAAFQDSAHVSNGVLPGDGVHVVWEELLGVNRARYAALTEQVIDAAEALRLGMVNEVLPPSEVLPRATELAEQLAARPTLLLRLTPLALRERLAARVNAGTTLGMALEGLTVADQAYRRAAPRGGPVAGGR